MAADQIEAGGVVLVRQGPDGPEVAVVHRPRRADWSLPKGKLERAERHDVAAVRETFEETGVRCALGPSLGQRRYVVDGVPKRVRYWRATPLEATEHEADDEIDEVRWLRRKAAKALLTYPDDRELVDVALALPDTTPLVVLRHAEATKRAAWRESGDPLADLDSARPLNPAGIDQAHRLAEVLAAFGPTLVVSSDARRCRATVEPYAERAGLALQIEHALSEEGCRDDPRETGTTVARLLGAREPAVWCTHRPVLPILVAALANELDLDRSSSRVSDGLDPRLHPGAALVLHRDSHGRVLAFDRLDA
jgi:8-oxo-dGTP diphosphatase